MLADPETEQGAGAERRFRHRCHCQEVTESGTTPRELPGESLHLRVFYLKLRSSEGLITSFSLSSVVVMSTNLSSPPAWVYQKPPALIYEKKA